MSGAGVVVLAEYSGHQGGQRGGKCLETVIGFVVAV